MLAQRILGSRRSLYPQLNEIVASTGAAPGDSEDPLASPGREPQILHVGANLGEDCVRFPPEESKMKSIRKIITALAFACALIVPVPAAAGGLDSFLGEIDVTARADLGALNHW